MEATIIGEDEKDIGTNVTDNNDKVHQIEMHKDTGEIYAHVSDGYPDKAADRTPEGNEYNEQARRFAQYYVYRERGYDTMPPAIHPERVNAVRAAVAALDETEIVDLFGDLYKQLASHQGSTDPVLEMPADISGRENVLYRQDVYLDLDSLQTEFTEEVEDLASRYDLDLSGDTANQSTIPQDALDSWQSFTEDLGDLVSGADLTDQMNIADVSSLYMAYVDQTGHEQIGEPDKNPFDRDPDTLIELPPMEPGTIDEFRAYLNHNLACQVRDCFIRMGLEPPEPFQILGFGRFEAAEQYQKLDMYPDYIDPEEEKAFI